VHAAASEHRRLARRFAGLGLDEVVAIGHDWVPWYTWYPLTVPDGAVPPGYEGLDI
jgi:hypothetical protein